MDYKTIEEEIYDFVDIYFDEELTLLEINLDFIEDNRLETPFSDYTFLHNFLKDILGKFKILDPNFISSSIIKLEDDIVQLEDTYNKFLDKTKDLKEIFQSTFVPKSAVLKSYASAILKMQERAEKSSDDFVDLKHKKQNLKKLKEIYFPIFEDIMYENKKIIQNDYKTCINSKMFYLDRIIWKNAYESQSIVKHMKIRKMEGEFSSKEYLKFIMSMMRPYTDEYKYLQKCLKVYR